MVSTGSGRLDLDLLISGPRDTLLHQLHRVREGAAGQAVVCPLLRGSSPTRGVAPKQHRGGAPRSPLSSPSRRARALMARPWSARCYGVARPREGSRQNSIGTPRFPFTPASTREGADGQAVVCPLLRGSSPTRGVAPKQHRGPRVSLLHQPQR